MLIEHLLVPGTVLSSKDTESNRNWLFFQGTINIDGHVIK
jgi:hypothetical protein